MKSKTLRQLNKAPLLPAQQRQFQWFRGRIGVKYEMEVPTNLSRWFLLRAALPGCVSTARCPHRGRCEVGLGLCRFLSTPSQQQPGPWAFHGHCPGGRGGRGCAELSCPSLRLCCQRGTGCGQRWMCIELGGLASQILHPHAHLFSYNVFLIPAFEFACILNCIICIAMPGLWLRVLGDVWESVKRQTYYSC